MSHCFFKSFAPDGLRECDGPVDRHHIIKQQTIRRNTRIPRLGYDAELKQAQRALRKALSDPRNLVTVCRRHHDLFHAARFSVPRDALPDGLEEFAALHGLEYELDRQFGAASLRGSEA